ncbi:MAG: HAMP domain-containing protein [Candidatus Magasanikbacteria bacterium]|nr:HAMP domain-containing protein [Candidatus Magasanikbacteria bacterium]
MDFFAGVVRNQHTVHAILITVIFGVQIAIAYVALRRYTGTKDTLRLFLFLAGSVFAAYSFFHAMVVPDFAISSEASFDIFEHYGLFLGSAALFIGALLGTRQEEYLYRFRHGIILWWVAGNVLFTASFILWPKLNEALYSWINYATGFSGVFFFLASLFFLRRFHTSREYLNAYTAVGLFILVGSAITPFFYEEWGVLWWFNHGVILLGGVAILAGLWRDSREEKEGGETRIPFYRKVSFKLTILILTVTIIPLSLLGFYSFYVSENALGRQAISNLALLSRANEGHVNAFLYQLKRTVADFSSDGSIRRLAKEGSGELLSQYVIKNKLPLDTYLVGINVIGSDGKVMASTHKTEIGKDESKDAYVIDGMKLAYGEALTLDYGESSHFETGEPLIASAAPVMSPDGTQNIGVIVAYFKADGLSAILSRGASGSDTLDVYLVNSNNLLMSTSRFAEHKAILHQVIDTLPVRNCRENRPTRGLFTDWRGKNVYGASVCFSDFGWTLIAEINDEEVDKPAETLKDLLVISSLLLAVAVIFVALIASSGAINSLRKLSTFAKKINQGDTDDKVEIDSTDEIGGLAKDLNTMGQTIKRREGDLTQTNIDLKKTSSELNEKMIDLEKSKKAVLNLLEDIDIEKKKVEQTVADRTNELRNEKARLLASINSLSFGFIIADLKHRILFKNKAMADLLGPRDASAQLVEDVSKVIGGERYDVQAQIEKCLKGKVVCEIKDIIFGKKFLRGVVAPIMMTEGPAEMIGYVFLLEDITKERELDRAKSNFISIASHQLRTPLSSVRWVLDMLMEEKLSVKQKGYLKDIYTSNSRLVNLVDDLLNSSKIEAGNVEVNKTDVDIIELVNTFVKTLQPAAEKKNQQITIVAKDKQKPATIDVKLFEMAFTNLLSNAIAYAPENAAIDVSVVGNGTECTVGVHNAKPVIPESERDKIFTKFYRAEEAKSLRPEGTGIGLFIAKSSAEMNGGKMWFNSNVKEGTTFYFTVPAK